MNSVQSETNFHRTSPTHWWKILPIRNGVLNASAVAFGSVMGTIGSIIVVRTLTPESYGAYSYYLWLAGVLGMVGTLAIPMALTKIVSELRGRGQEREAYALAQSVAFGLLVLNLLASLILAILAINAPAPQRTYLLIIATILGPHALFAVFRASLLGGERYTSASVATTVASILQLTLIIGVHAMGWGAPGFLAAVLSAKIVQGVGLSLAFRHMVGRSIKAVAINLPSRATLWSYLAFCLPATLSLPVSYFSERSEVFFLARYHGLSQVGYYSLAFTVFVTFLDLGWALMNGFFPAISRDYGASEWDGIQQKIQHGLMLASIYAIPLSFGGWAILRSLFTLLYGSKMLPAVPVAQLLFVGLLPGVVAKLLVATLSAAGGVWLIVSIVVFVSAVNVAFDLLLIPPFGTIGGAFAATTSQVIFAALLLIAAERMYGVKIPVPLLARVVMIGALTSFALPVLTQSWLTGFWGMATSIALVVYPFEN